MSRNIREQSSARTEEAQMAAEQQFALEKLRYANQLKQQAARNEMAYKQKLMTEAWAPGDYEFDQQGNLVINTPGGHEFMESLIGTYTEGRAKEAAARTAFEGVPGAATTGSRVLKSDLAVEQAGRIGMDKLGRDVTRKISQPGNKNRMGRPAPLVSYTGEKGGTTARTGGKGTGRGKGRGTGAAGKGVTPFTYSKDQVKEAKAEYDRLLILKDEAGALTKAQKVSMDRQSKIIAKDNSEKQQRKKAKKTARKKITARLTPDEKAARIRLMEKYPGDKNVTRALRDGVPAATYEQWLKDEK